MIQEKVPEIEQGQENPIDPCISDYKTNEAFL